MRGKILCVLCVVLVAACGVARPQEGDVSALLDRAKQCVADVTVQTVDWVVAAADGDVSIPDAANDVYDSLKPRSYASGPGAFGMPRVKLEDVSEPKK